MGWEAIVLPSTFEVREYHCALTDGKVKLAKSGWCACEMCRCMAVRFECERDDGCCVFVQLCPKHRPSQAVLRGLWKMEVVSA